MVVSVERNGDRAMVLAAELSDPMIREGGVWRIGTFSADDLWENFRMATDDEVKELFQEAKAALEAMPPGTKPSFKD